MSGHHLPDGRRGQLLAAGLLMSALALLWAVIVAPLIGWYGARQTELAALQVQTRQMAALGREIPSFRAALASTGSQNNGGFTLLAGDTDAIAGANLESAIQALAAQAGTSIDSAELLPVQRVGALRRVELQVSLTTAWPALVALLEAIGTARPRMVVDQINVTRSANVQPEVEQPMAVTFTVASFAGVAQ